MLLQKIDLTWRLINFKFKIKPGNDVAPEQIYKCSSSKYDEQSTSHDRVLILQIMVVSGLFCLLLLLE